EIGDIVAANPEKYKDAAALRELALQKIPATAFTNAGFDKAFTDLILSNAPGAGSGGGAAPGKPKVDNPINATNPPEGAVPVHPVDNPGPPQAPSYAENYLRTIPNQPWVNEQVGRRSLERNDFDAAFKDYSKALEMGD